MADNYDVGSLVASIQLDVSNLQRDISSATSAFSNLGGKIDSMATSVTRSEGYLKNMSSQMGNMRDDMLQYTIAIESAIRALPAAFQQAGTGSAAGMRIMQESMEAAKATSYTLNTVIASQLEALTAKVNAQTAQIASSFSRLGREMKTSMEAGFAQVAGGGSLGGIEARLANARAGMRGVETATRGAGDAAQLLSTYLRKADSNFTTFTSGAMGKIRGLTTDLFFMQMLTQQIASGFEFAFGQGIKFSIEMENALMGISGVIGSVMQLDGKDMSFDQSMSLATIATERLRVAALSTTTTMGELVSTFQGIVGPAAAMGMKFDEIVDITVVGSTAVKALGLKKDQLVQEMRSILTGNITARSSAVATALGITNEDIENAKSQVGGVYAFLKDRMANLSELAKRQGSSFEAIWSNITDGIQQTQEKAFSGMFSVLKAQLKEVQDIFFQTITNEEGKEVAILNPETVALFKELAGYAIIVYESIRNWAIALSENDNFVSRIRDTWNAIKNLAAYVFIHFSDIAEKLGLIYVVSGGWMRLLAGVIAYFDGIPEALEFIKNHIDVILALVTLWVGLFSPLTRGLLLAIELYLQIQEIQKVNLELTALNSLRTIEFSGIVQKLAAAFGLVNVSASVALTTIALRLAMMLPLIAAVTYAIYKMHEAFANKEVRDYRGRQALEGQYTGGTYEDGQQPESLSDLNKKDYKVTERSAADAKRDDDNLYTKSERQIVEAENAMRFAKTQAEALAKKLGSGASELTPKYGGLGGGKAPKAGGGVGDAVRAEMADIEGALKAANDAIKYQLDELKYNYQEHNISIEEYFSQAATLTKQMTQNEIDALNAKLEVAIKESERTKIQQEINLKTQQLDRESIKLLREKTKAYKEMDKMLKDLEATSAERSGDFAKASLIKFDAQNEENLKKLNVEIAKYEKNLATLTPEQQKYLERLKEGLKVIEDGRVIKERQGKWNTVLLEQKQDENILAEKKLELDKQLKSGAISEIEYKQGIIDANNAQADALEALLPKMEAIAAAETTDMNKKAEYAAAITNLKGKLVELREPLSAIAKQVKTDFADATASAFEEVIMGTKSVTEAFQDMAKSILASLAKIMAQSFASNISTGLFSIFGGGSSAPPSAGFSWPTFATGGEIEGPGTATSDSIPTMLSNGEFVIRAASVSKIGKNALEYINNFGSLPKLHYAEGGMVGSSSAATSSPFANLKIELINNTGVQAKATANEPKFNGTEYVMSIMIDGISRNVMGSRDMITALGKRG